MVRLVSQSRTESSDQNSNRFPEGDRNREAAQSWLLRANREQITHLGGEHEWNGGVEVRVRVWVWETEVRTVVLTTSSDTVAHGRCFSDRKQRCADGKWVVNKPLKKSLSVIQEKKKKRGMLSQSRCSWTLWGAIFSPAYCIHVKERQMNEWANSEKNGTKLNGSAWISVANFKSK